MKVFKVKETLLGKSDGGNLLVYLTSGTISKIVFWDNYFCHVCPLEWWGHRNWSHICWCKLCFHVVAALISLIQVLTGIQVLILRFCLLVTLLAAASIRSLMIGINVKELWQRHCLEFICILYFWFFAQDWLNIFSCDKFLHSYHETKIIANQLISCPSFPYL